MTREFIRILLFVLLSLIIVGCCPHRFIPKSVPDPLPTIIVPKQIRVAVVLGSGGVRGMAHIGVLEELELEGIKVDLIVGCSAGSIVGALYADNPNVDAIKHTVWKIRSASLLDIDIWNCCFGLSQGRTMRRILNNTLGADNFEDLKIPLVVVATDLHSGELVPLASGSLVKAVQASCSIPFVYVPSEIGGRILVDGGVINPVPVRVAKDLGAEVIIAVDLCELLTKTFPTNLFGVATRSAEIVFMWQNQRCTKDADVIIRPKTCGVGTFNDRMKLQLYLAGRRAAREQMPKIKELLAEAARKNGIDHSCEKRIYQLHCYTPKIAQEEL